MQNILKKLVGYSFLHESKNRIDAYCSYNSFDRPVFIISPPRAGSTFLFKCLAQFDEVYHIDWEADRFWWYNFPYERLDAPSDWVGAAEATPEKKRTLRRQLYQTSVSMHLRGRSKRFKIPYQFGFKSIRYLEKTIANCFHLEFIERTFPGAQFVFLVRDPRANISSMIEGWPYLEKFGKSQLTPVLQELTATIPHWTYPAPPGWQDVVSKPLPKICAWSWKQHVKYPLNFFQQRSHLDVIWVRYEDLVDDPLGTVSNLADRLDLAVSENVKQYLEKPSLSHTTISKPYLNKWMEQNYEEVLSILPVIEDIAQEIGYDVSVASMLVG